MVTIPTNMTGGRQPCRSQTRFCWALFLGFGVFYLCVSLCFNTFEVKSKLRQTRQMFFPPGAASLQTDQQAIGKRQTTDSWDIPNVKDLLWRTPQKKHVSPNDMWATGRFVLCGTIKGINLDRPSERRAWQIQKTRDSSMFFFLIMSNVRYARKVLCRYFYYSIRQYTRIICV